MEGYLILLILLVIACVVSGPVALIISIIALNKTKQVYGEPPRRVEKPAKEEIARSAVVIPEAVEVRQDKRAVEPAEAAIQKDKKKTEKEVLRAAAERIKEKSKVIADRKTGTLEQRIGTRWVLIAGIITVIFAVGFFLKYAYDTNLIGPLGRVVIAAVGGLIALAVGEIPCFRARSSGCSSGTVRG